MITKSFQFLRTRVFVKRRRGNLANTDLLVDKVRFVTLYGIENSVRLSVQRQRKSKQKHDPQRAHSSL